MAYPLDSDRPGAPLLRPADRRSPSDIDRGRPGRRASVSPPPSLSDPRLASAPFTRPRLPRRNTFRSQSPATNAPTAARQKYTYAAFFLAVSLVSFTVQTELAAWVQHTGKWNKAYCMLYLTHGSWSLLWPVQLGILRLQKRDMPWPQFWRRHVWLVRSTAQMVELQDLEPPKVFRRGPWAYMARTTAFVTCSLTVAGLSWYIAVNLTSPSDLTAIYNTSAFFAYAFSVPFLKERLRADKGAAVGIAILGVLIVAYGDSKAVDRRTAGGTSTVDDGPGADGGQRLLGNLIMGGGSVLYGLYEVLYKRFACPPDGCSPGRGMIFANTFGSLIGLFTLTFLWIPLPVLHILGIETFELPHGKVAWYLFLSVVMNATFAGSFLVLISLTSPVLSSVASLLTIFIVAMVDWFVTGEPLSPAALFGGGLIMVAFGMLSWSTYREMAEDERKRAMDLRNNDDGDDENDDDDDDELGRDHER